MFIWFEPLESLMQVDRNFFFFFHLSFINLFIYDLKLLFGSLAWINSELYMLKESFIIWATSA